MPTDLNRVHRPMIELDNFSSSSEGADLFRQFCQRMHSHGDISVGHEIWMNNIDGVFQDTYTYNNGYFQYSNTQNVRILSIDFPEDNVEQRASSATVVLSLSDPAKIQQFLNVRTVQYFYQCYIWMYFTGPGIVEVLGPTWDPWEGYFYIMWTGYLDDLVIEDSGDSTIVTLTFTDESGFADTPIEYKYTTEDQKAIAASGLVPAGISTVDIANDQGFKFVEQLQKWTGFWGAQTAPGGKKKKKRGDRKRGRGARGS